MNPATAAPTVLAIGDLDRAEFRSARDSLARGTRLHARPTLDAALAFLAADEPPVDLIVVAQSFPNEHPADAVEHLGRLAPQARIITLLGSWCEGEARTGRPWPGAIRVYWHQWSPWFERGLAQAAQGRPFDWDLPITCGDEERALFQASQPLPSGEGLVGIQTASFVVWDWLAAAYRRAGFSAVRLTDSSAPPKDAAEGLRAIVLEWPDDRSSDRLAAIRRLRTSYPSLPLLVLLGFPRIEDDEQAREAGADSVLSMPVCVEDLLRETVRATAAATSADRRRRPCGP